MLLPLLQPREVDSDTSSSNLPASTWVPVAIVVSVLTILSVLACMRKSFRQRIASMGSGVAVANGMPVTRELTAEQLAGSINRAPTAPARPRRPRRTPSQISTISLPAYMKEPGEQELVVTRGPDGDDIAMPAATAVAEEDESNEGHQTDGGDEPNDRRQSTLSNNGRYSPVPHSAHSTPLLAPDPRGDAPAYFEVVDEQYPPGISIAPPEPALPAAPQRRSGFFSIFRPAPAPIPTPTAGASSSTLSLTHTRTRSTTALSPSPSPSPTPALSPSSPPVRRHRASTSTSTLFSLGRKKSSASLSANANDLNSPSLISLASISAPLPHTLVKTEFTSLPKGGLTPEQLTLISGTREGGVSRFGVPWGEAAVAYAHASASTSRVALDGAEAPPPGWEEWAVARADGTSAPTSGSGSAAHAQQEEEPEHQPEGEVVLVVPPRSESRASGVSMQSFATAEEGPAEDEPDEVPPTQAHAQEATDATVRP
ncbi:hypothetical protein GGX14DRAFT_670291 [Mycena pura]|uniref:Proteophosphoglycan ppg4 n=1 Tax=Mycena pura TaxID=153505 RepID=A0AAD6YKP1_9AGAR|nr:hypothetical protein GGX14DRAFT_670291 [Mycena pura]